MYKCLDCETEFELFKIDFDEHNEVDTRRTETIGVCPNCHSSDFEEVNLCPCCHEQYVKSDKDICENCETDIFDALNGAIEDIKLKTGLFDISDIMSTIDKWADSIGG